ncbi:MAG: winged helix-turn-helix transcriptional regulator [Candidatus Lokiarchaeota archaeon]|nr:winged helix-turn-helix transcriptional regulator [Candidatus Lokiarchaeota archaeon]
MKSKKLMLIALFSIVFVFIQFNYLSNFSSARMERINGFEAHDWLNANDNATYVFNNNISMGISTNAPLEIDIKYDQYIINRQINLSIDANDSLYLEISTKTNLVDFGFSHAPENPRQERNVVKYNYNCIYSIISNQSISNLSISFLKTSQNGLISQNRYQLALYEPAQNAWVLVNTTEKEIEPSSETYLESELSNLEAGETYYFTLYEISETPPPDWTGTIIIVGITILIGILAIVLIISKTDYIKYLKTRTVAISTGPHRLSLEDVLENENRSTIIDIILKEPGIHFNELLRKTELAAGNLVWHLEILDKYKIIGKKDVGRYVVYFPYYQKNPISNIDLKLQKSRLTLEILEMIEEDPGLWNSAISKRLEIDHKTVLYHLNKLMDLGLIIFKKDGRKKKYFPNFESDYFNGKS